MSDELLTAVRFASSFVSFMLFFEMALISLRFYTIVSRHRERLEEIGFLGKDVNMPIRSTLACVLSIMAWSLFSGLGVLVSIAADAPFNWVTIPTMLAKIAFYFAVKSWSSRLFQNVEERLGE